AHFHAVIDAFEYDNIQYVNYQNGYAAWTNGTINGNTVTGGTLIKVVGSKCFSPDGTESFRISNDLNLSHGLNAGWIIQKATGAIAGKTAAKISLIFERYYADLANFTGYNGGAQSGSFSGAEGYNAGIYIDRPIQQWDASIWIPMAWGESRSTGGKLTGKNDTWWLLPGVSYLVYNRVQEKVFIVKDEFVDIWMPQWGDPINEAGNHTFNVNGVSITCKSQLFNNGYAYMDSLTPVWVPAIYNHSAGGHDYLTVNPPPAEIGAFVEAFQIGSDIYINYVNGAIKATLDFGGYRNRVYIGRRYNSSGDLLLNSENPDYFLDLIDKITDITVYNNPSQQIEIKNILKAKYAELWNAGYSLGIPHNQIVNWDGIYGLSFFWGDSVADPFASAPNDTRHGVSTLRVEYSAGTFKTYLLTDTMLELWVKVIRLPFFPLKDIYPAGDAVIRDGFTFQAFSGKKNYGTLPFNGYLVLKDNDWQSFAYTELGISEWLAGQEKLAGRMGNGGMTAATIAEQNKLRGEQLLTSTLGKYWNSGQEKAWYYWNINTNNNTGEPADIWHLSTLHEAVMYYLEMLPSSASVKNLERELYGGYKYFQENRDDNYTIYFLWYSPVPYSYGKDTSQFDDNSVTARNFIHKYRIDKNDTDTFGQAKGIMLWTIDGGWDRSVNPITGKEFGGNDQGYAARSSGAYYKPICANEIVLTDILQIAELTDDPEEKTFYMEWAHRYYDFCINTYRLENSLFGDYIGCVRENNVTISHGILATDMYTYHQGAMMEAGVRMYKASGDLKYLNQAKETARAAHEYFGRRDIIPGYWQPDYNIYHWFNILQLRGYMMLAQVDRACRDEFDPYIKEWQKSIDYAYENFYLDGLLPTLFLQGWIMDNPFGTAVRIMDAAAYAQYYFMLSMYAAGMEIN
ncbi:MAG: hypothetical protein FWF22_08350, partial [Treponema sp.]|nr:hypothetical protein [Treponema sp.]